MLRTFLRRLSFRARIGMASAAMIAVVLVVTGLGVIRIYEEQLWNIGEMQMRDSMQNAVSEMKLLHNTVEAGKFDRRFDQYLSEQRRSYSDRGYNITQFLIDSSGTVRQYGSLPGVPGGQPEIARILEAKEGVLKVGTGSDAYVLAFSYSPERRSEIVMAVPQADINQPLYRSRQMIMIIGAVILLLSLLVNWHISGSLVRPLELIIGTIDEIGRGNLDARVETRGMTGEMRRLGASVTFMQKIITDFIKEMEHLVLKLGDSGRRTEGQADQVEAGADLMRNRCLQIGVQVEAQLKASQGNRSLITELEREVMTIDERNASSAATALCMANVAEKAQISMAGSLEKVRELQKAAAGSQEKLDQAFMQIREVSDINQSLAEIARETRYVALNATIQSARAGELGRPFESVAANMSRLATESHALSERTSRLLKHLVAKWGSFGEGYRELSELVDICSSLVGESKRVFDTIKDLGVQNQEQVLAVTEAVESMRTNLARVTGRTDDIRKMAVEIDASVSDMLYEADNQKINTGFTLQNARLLLDLAQKLAARVQELAPAGYEQASITENLAKPEDDILSDYFSGTPAVAGV